MQNIAARLKAITSDSNVTRAGFMKSFCLSPKTSNTAAKPFFEHEKWQNHHRTLEHVFVSTEFNETVLEREGGSEPDGSHGGGRAAGSLLAEITPSLIATVEWSCRRITGTACDCVLSASSDEQKVPLTCSYLTGLLSASRALCLLDRQSGRKKLSAQVWAK